MTWVLILLAIALVALAIYLWAEDDFSADGAGRATWGAMAWVGNKASDMWQWSQKEGDDAKPVAATAESFNMEMLAKLAVWEPRDPSTEFSTHLRVQVHASAASVAYSHGDREKLKKNLADLLIDAERLAALQGIKLGDVMRARYASAIARK